MKEIIINDRHFITEDYERSAGIPTAFRCESMSNKRKSRSTYNMEKNKKEITLNEYQSMALETAIYKQPVIYPTLGLTGEAGEVSDKVKKVLRDNDSIFTDEKKREIAKEIGDVLWYVATLSHDIGYTLEEIALMNHDKLHSRQKRGELHGNGDNR